MDLIIPKKLENKISQRILDALTAINRLDTVSVDISGDASDELGDFINNSHDDFCSIEKTLERIEKDGVGSGNGISEKTLLSAIEIVSKQK